MEDIVRIHLKGFRAIKDADIKLNGITLVSGVNGCGKSTISKFLYHIFDLSLTYNRQVDRQYLVPHLRKILIALERVNSELDSLLEMENSQDDYSLIGRLLQLHAEGGKWSDSPDYALHLVEKIRRDYRQYSQSQEDENVGIEVTRLLRILQDSVDVNEALELDVFDVLDLIAEKIEGVFVASKETKKKRPKEVLLEPLQQALGLPQDYGLIEYGDSLISSNPQHPRAKEPHWVSKSLYIGTPTYMGANKAAHIPDLYWQNLIRLLEDNRGVGGGTSPQYSTTLVSRAVETILGGDVVVEKEKVDDTRYFYFRADGQRFNLSDCATGIKAFSILQLLLKNGHLDDRTLLIIDEPEAHLHPQWVVEYARMVVLLNKHLGVKFFLASHNPDFVSALKYIAEKEGVGERTNFYLAEEDENDPNQFNYRSLGLDIEPIFESFNIALDRISQYGATE